MDERHWWIASKFEQTFCIEKTTTADASFTEAYFRRPDILDKVNSFLFAKGSNKLFFYSTRDRFATKDIACCHNIPEEYGLINEPLDNIILLYFLRTDTSSDAIISPVPDIFFGEIKHITQLTSLFYSQTLFPLFKRSLAPTSKDTPIKASTKTNILTQLEKQIEGINYTCQTLQKDKNLVNFV